jgi:hypothetical protein
MALETARQKNLTDTISETEFKLGETELKLIQMKKSKTQVIRDCCSLIQFSKIVFTCLTSMYLYANEHYMLLAL